MKENNQPQLATKLDYNTRAWMLESGYQTGHHDQERDPAKWFYWRSPADMNANNVHHDDAKHFYMILQSEINKMRKEQG